MTPDIADSDLQGELSESLPAIETRAVHAVPKKKDDFIRVKKGVKDQSTSTKDGIFDTSTGKFSLDNVVFRKVTRRPAASHGHKDRVVRVVEPVERRDVGTDAQPPRVLVVSGTRKHAQDAPLVPIPQPTVSAPEVACAPQFQLQPITFGIAAFETFLTLQAALAVGALQKQLLAFPR